MFRFYTAMTNMNRELLARLANALEGREEILEAYLFGSRARRQAQPHSDIDVAVYIDEECAHDGAWGYQSRKDRSECPKSDSLSRFRTLATDSPDSERDGSVSAEKRGGKNVPFIVVPPGRLQMDEYFLVPATPDQVYDRSSLDTLGREIGGADGIRTHDPLNAIQVLFQLSYSPTLKSSETGL